VIAPLLASICVTVSSAYRCTCVVGPPLPSRTAVTEAVAQAAGVFDGTVVALARARDSIAEGSTGRFQYWDEVHATVVVRRRWKASVSDTVLVKTPEQTTACGFEFKVGGRYLIFASLTSGGHFATTKCMPTVIWAREAEIAVRLLGAPP
jgi:hypothetical protein